MAEFESDSRCRRIQEGKKPLRACTLCRREDCKVWQDALEETEELSYPDDSNVGAIVVERENIVSDKPSPAEPV